MLEISKVSWRNFLSYGDYESVLDLSKAGSCLITGEIEEESVNSEAKKSNGSGKSSIPNAILWGLFGRTMHSASSGDSVINHFTKKTCEVKIDFLNGDQILRRRNPGGTTELLYTKDGSDNNFTADTVSTTKAMQVQLNKIFNLDFEIFCGSVFFNQYGRPWMEMTEASRRKALERILRVDRFTYYSQVAKSKAENTRIIYNNIINNQAAQKASKDRIINDIKNYEDISNSFEANRQKRLKDINDAIFLINQKIDAIIIPDIDKLTEKWALIDKIKIEIDKLKSSDLILYKEQASIEAKLSLCNKNIDLVKAQDGRKCSSCGQEIPSSLVINNVKKLDEEKKIHVDALNDLSSKRKDLTDSIKKYESLLTAKVPGITIVEANNMSLIVLNHKAEIKRLEKMAGDVGNDTDPNHAIIQRLKDSLKDIETQIIANDKRLEELILLDKHYTYLYKSYNDRNKVKSFMCEEHVPYINSRLEHYLHILNLDIKLRIENDLKVTSNLWGYDYQSGGERKRSDLAFMLACNDFYEMMYGRQCNLMVLDEVDGRMDEDGIDGLINIIRNELSARVDNILIISHRNQMYDVFDKELKVKRINRMSMLVGN